MKVILTDHAMADLDRLHDFIAGDLANQAAAGRIVGEILDALESLADMPQRFPLLDPEHCTTIHRMVIDAGSGYVATFDRRKNARGEEAEVHVLVIRAAREAGF